MPSSTSTSSTNSHKHLHQSTHTHIHSFTHPPTPSQSPSHSLTHSHRHHYPDSSVFIRRLGSFFPRRDSHCISNCTINWHCTRYHHCGLVVSLPACLLHGSTLLSVYSSTFFPQAVCLVHSPFELCHVCPSTFHLLFIFLSLP